MAHAVDDNSDLDELTVQPDSVTERFMKAADRLQTLMSKVDNQMLLTLYGYYKQGLEGPCNTPKPSWYDMKAKAKWEAWKKLDKMPSVDAKMSYIKLIEELDPNFAQPNCENTTAGNKEGWVTVSTLQSKETELRDDEKSLTDYVKEGNSTKVAKILKSLGKDQLVTLIDKIDDDGLGLIHWAADRGCVNILEVLLSSGANVNLADGDLQTALHYAASCGHIDCVNFLLKNGADVNAKDADGLDAKDVTSDNTIKELLTNCS